MNGSKIPATKSIYFAGILIVVLTTVTFGRSLQAGFIWDDVPLISANRYIKDWRYLGRNLSSSFWNVGLQSETQLKHERANLYYRPVVTLSYMVDHALFGSRAWGFHLTNLLLHLTAVCLSFWVALSLIRLPIWAATAGTLIFALHPSRVEAVTWVSGRTDLLMSLFLLGAVFAAAKAFDHRNRGRRLLFAAAGLLCGLFAMLSKEGAVALAIIVPAVDFLVVNREQPATLKRHMRFFHLPLVALALLFVISRVGFKALVLATENTGYDLLTRMKMVLATTTHYAQLLFLPYAPNAQVAAYFPLNRVDPWWFICGAVLVALFVAVLAASFRRRAWLMAWALIFFAATIAPVLNMIPLDLNTLVAERFLYLPVCALGWIVAMMLCRATRPVRLILGPAVGLLLVTWAITSFVRIGDFSDNLTFWRSTVASDPSNPLAQQQLGQTYQQQGNYARAEKHLADAYALYRRLDPRYAFDTQLRLINVWIVRTPKTDEATLRKISDYLDELIKLSNAKPGPSQSASLTLQDRAVAFSSTTEEARATLLRNRPVLHAILGTLKSQLGEDRQAVSHLNSSIAVNREDLSAYLNLTLAHARAGQFLDARKTLERAELLAPDSRSVNKMRQLIDRADALSQLISASEQQSDLPTLKRRAEFFLMLHTPGRAVAVLQQVTSVFPAHRIGWALLATTQAAAGNLKAAQDVLASARNRFGNEPGLTQLAAEIEQSHKQWRQTH